MLITNTHIYVPRFVAFMLPMLIVVAMSHNAFAQSPRPIWEYGIGGGTVQRPTYPGSDDFISRSIALPYFIYRGEVVSVDENGIRTSKYFTDRLEADLSVAGAFGAQSSNDADRIGMPNLDYLLELGPKLVYHAIETSTPHTRHNLDFALKLREVFAITKLKFADRGQSFEAEMQYEHYGRGARHMSYFMSASFLFGTDALNDYFYGVSPHYAHEARPAYRAEAGYMGAEVNLGVGYRINSDLRIAVGSQTYLGDGAVNRHSPLHKKTQTHAFALGFVWRLGKSDRLMTRQNAIQN